MAELVIASEEGMCVCVQSGFLIGWRTAATERNPPPQTSLGFKCSLLPCRMMDGCDKSNT